MRAVTKANGDVMVFRYDAAGNRIEKKLITPDTTFSTHYIRDASGNLMATYTNAELKEQPIYGSSRVGMLQKMLSNLDETTLTEIAEEILKLTQNQKIMNNEKERLEPWPM